MLETIREFATDQLEASPFLEDTRRRHAEVFCTLAEEAEPELTGTRQAQWVARLAADHENLRASLAFAERALPAVALQLTSSLVIFWYIRSLYGEAAEWLERALAVGQDTDAARTKALWGLGLHRTLLGDLTGAREPLEMSLTRADASGDDSIAARAQSMLGLLAFFADDVDEARRRFEDSVSRARRARDTWSLADALGTLASIYPLQGDLHRAEDVGREGLAIARANRDEHGMRMALFGLALSASRSGEHELVRERAAEGLEISRDLGDLWFTSYFLWLLADASVGLRDNARAAREADESVEVAQRIDSSLLLTCALEVHARVERERGNRAAAFRDVADALLAADRGGVPRSYVATALLTRAELLAADGTAQEAAAVAERAERLALDVRDVVVVERAQLMLQRSAEA